MISILTLLVVMTLSILITRVAIVALTYTGLSGESAKFQARVPQESTSMVLNIASY